MVHYNTQDDNLVAILNKEHVSKSQFCGLWHKWMFIKQLPSGKKKFGLSYILFQHWVL